MTVVHYKVHEKIQVQINAIITGRSFKVARCAIAAVESDDELILILYPEQLDTGNFENIRFRGQQALPRNPD